MPSLFGHFEQVMNTKHVEASERVPSKIAMVAVAVNRQGEEEAH